MYFSEPEKFFLRGGGEEEVGEGGGVGGGEGRDQEGRHHLLVTRQVYQ